MDDLTKEQHHFITSLYKEFLCRQPALPSDKARVFSDASFIQENIFPEYSLDKIVSLCCSLKNAGYLSCMNYNNTVYNVTISDKTIIHMEQRFSNGLKDVVSFLSKLIPYFFRGVWMLLIHTPLFSSLINFTSRIFLSGCSGFASFIKYISISSGITISFVFLS